jgi:hypothetical protein
MDPNLKNLNAPTPRASIFALDRWTDLAFHRWTASQTDSPGSPASVRPRRSFTAVVRQHAALCRHSRSKTDPPCRACRSRPSPLGSPPDDSQFVGRNGSIISGFEHNSWNYAAVRTRADPAPAARSPETSRARLTPSSRQASTISARPSRSRLASRRSTSSRATASVQAASSTVVMSRASAMAKLRRPRIPLNGYKNSSDSARIQR